MEELKALYIQSASLIPNWEKLSRNDCANGYVENINKDDELATAYLSALIIKFWNILTKNYYSQQIKIANEYDCHDILIDGIMKALNAHVWTDPNNILYGDPNGPEKAINVCLMSTKINFFNAVNRNKRKVNYTNASLNKLEEDSADGFYIQAPEEDFIGEGFYDSLIIKLFNDKEYFVAFVLDGLLTFNFFDLVNKEYRFNKKKLKHHLKYVDIDYLKIFAGNYNLDYNLVKKAHDDIACLMDSDIDRLIDNAFEFLRQNKEFRDYVSGGHLIRVIAPVKLW